MTLFKAGLFGLLAYVFVSLLLFGGPFQALGLLTFWRDRLGLDYWPAIIPVAMVFAFFVSRYAVQSGMPRPFFSAVFVAVSMSFSALLVGGYAEYRRADIVEEFKPDAELKSSIYASFHNAPREFQFFLHGAALKDCTPYAWSYRQMAFYELPPNVAINVLPSDWIQECKILRTR